MTVQYLSPPASVRMADDYYALATPDHFWVQRRFQVVRRLSGQILPSASAIAEIGCGNGVLQRQIEDAYWLTVTGFDLNAFALERSIARDSPVICYDIHERRAELAGRFDVLLLFDVLEHIPDESAFLDALRFHLAPGGRLILNVPALPWLWSKYDTVTGHCRRYTIQTLRQSVERAGFTVQTWSYWGAPLIPMLYARKLWVNRLPEEQVYAAGFGSNGLLNTLMSGVSRCEMIPNHWIGASLMVVLEAQ